MTRARIALVLMVAGITSGVYGVFLVAGLGYALVTLAVCLVALSILIGWE